MRPSLLLVNAIECRAAAWLVAAIFTAVLGSAALSDVPSPEHAGIVASGAVVTSTDGQRVSLDVAGLPLHQCLEQLAAQARFVLHRRGPLDEAVTLRLDEIPLRRALAILLGERSHMMRFAPAAPGAPQRLISLHVRDHGGGQAVTFRPSTMEKASAARGPRTPDEERAALHEVARSARLPAGEAVVALVADLELAKSAQVRHAATQALGRIGTPAALRALDGALRDPDSVVRAAALRELGAARGAYAARQLADTLRYDDDLATRVQAARHLGNHPGALAHRALSAALGDPDPTVRSTAEQSLALVTGRPGWGVRREAFNQGEEP